MSNIKGISIEIGADTKGFKKGLSELNKSSRDLQRELSAVNKALKHDPKNTELLRQKQELLTKSIDDTKTRLEALKAAKERADRDMANGTEINQEEYRKLVREISFAENSLKNLTDEMKKFGSVSAQQIAAVGGKMQEFGGNIEDAGKKMLPVTGAATGIAAVSVKTAADFDSAMSNVAAISGATGDELETLRDKAKEMGSQTKFSASESADAMSYMAMAGWKTEDMLNGIDGVMQLAAASGEDLATTSDILTDGLTAFGLSAKESGRMADVMAAASSNANTNVTILGESYKYCASTAGAMGYSLEDITESLGLMANAGVKGSQAGTTLKNAMINMAKPTDAMAAAMDNYNISITNSDGSMKSWNEVVNNLRESLGGLSEAEQTAAVATIFGKEATAGMLSVINAAPADIEKLNNAITNSTGVANDMANTMNDNLNGQITELKSQLEGLAISIGEVLMPFVRDIVEHLQGFVEKLSGMDDGTKKVIIVVSLLAAAIGPVLIVIGQLITAVGTILTFAPTLVSALGAVKVAFAAIGGPVTIVIAAITALVVKLVHAYNTSEEFRNRVNNAFASVRDAVTGALSAAIGKAKEFVNVGKNVMEGIWNGISDKVEWLKGKVKGVVDKIKSWFTSKEGFDTHSPSKWSEKIGEYVMQGLGIGMKNDNTAVKAAQKATAKIGDAIEKELDATNAEILRIQKESEDERAVEELAQYKENLAKKQAELKKAEPKNRQAILDEIAKIEKNWNKKQVEAARTAEQNKLQERLSALQKFKQEYESELASIEAKQSSLNDKLSDYGKLFTWVKDENSDKEIFKLENMDESIKQIQRYNEQIESLKVKGISNGLLSEIADMNIDDALEFTKKLDELSPEKFSEYVQKYEEKQRIANEAARQFYSNEMDELEKTALEKASSYVDDFVDVGTAITDGVAEGIEDGKSAIVNAIIRAIRAAIKAAKEEAGMDSDSGSDGKHRTGLNTVPFDGYRAILHKGEMVLTQPEADRYRRNAPENKTENFNVYIGTVVNKDERTTKDLMNEMEFYRRKRASATGGAA